jgi:hypothetical protein
MQKLKKQRDAEAAEIKKTADQTNSNDEQSRIE